MLWRVRTTLPDRPGALASLAAACGEAGVNILGFQIFPGVAAVTDELVLSTPDGWGIAEISELLDRSGGHSVSAAPCTEAALTDQPTRYVQAARSVLASPASFPEVAARLFDAEAGASGDHDVMGLVVGDVQVQVSRAAPFTATEHARGAALADLVSDVLAREHVPPSSRLVGGGKAPEYAVAERTVSALVDGEVVGMTAVGTDGVVTLRVDPAWQRRGIGTRLLVDGARLASALGVEEIVLTTRSDNQAVLPMVMAAGLRGRIRMAGDTLTVRIGVRDLKPLRA
ncbi:GNAT family N-acetyltransferase [Nocardioides sp. MAH-18]|uniref:GNAT family N-acetyltransferase n=1 Tax=Nocardioides agri TaxID=2682843 RepID=A0A6L6XVV5_9ACTN|nr:MULTISPECIES: GNAT family N-acetyltransferase [unclassified Nocardioides]MBA2956015.1 GNAT family N-acetyltransferase [Nocardioides sp. CGMCC 1.13656]MVQ50863.1 GNAT family N-acetyltransferase [Nocardioides sp. MAH-18]